MPKGDKLSPRQMRFVAEYLHDENATQACIRAGYSQQTATTQGPRLLENVGIQDAIRRAQENRIVRTEITQDRVLQELALLAFSDVHHYYVGKRGAFRVKKRAPVGASRAVSSIKHRTIRDKEGNTTYEVEFRLWNKPGPLELAGRHTGLFADKGEAEDKPTTIVVNTHCARPPEVESEEAAKEGT